MSSNTPTEFPENVVSLKGFQLERSAQNNTTKERKMAVKFKDSFADKPKMLDVQNLVVNFRVHGGEVYAVRDVSFYVRKGECLCIVGESGSGKSVTVQALMNLLPTPPARILGGKALMGNQDLMTISVAERRKILGSEIAMIFQDPLASLNPTMTVGKQVEEVLILHTDLDKTALQNRVKELFELVRIPEPARRISQYPHELSGGMRQRVMIAMALACNPKVLIADEPTTALDVTIQAQILTLIKELGQKFDMATILITHDMGVVAQMADRVAVMYAGKIVEEGTVDAVFFEPKHPYTLGLKKAMPKEGGTNSEKLEPIPGTPPDLFSPPPGCAFAIRCPSAMLICHQHQPKEMAGTAGARVSCWLHHGFAKDQMEKSGLSALNVEGKNQ
jgi:oligopeptide transport system ATP-binding protein